MSDFVISSKRGAGIDVDDVLIDRVSRIVRHIARDNHRRCMVSLDDIDGIRRERRGWEGGPDFEDWAQEDGWSRRV